MIAPDIAKQLRTHRRPTWLWDPRRTLSAVEDATTEAGLTTWVGQRPSGALERVRQAEGAVALRRLLDEVATVGRLRRITGIAPLRWTARTGPEGLAAAFGWGRPPPMTPPLSIRWVAATFATLSRTVGEMHRADVLHCALRPEAVGWRSDPRETLVWDLTRAQPPGTARRTTEDSPSARYASPEQVAGEPLTPASDVYALGVMLYSAFTQSRFPPILVPGGPAPGTPSLHRAALSPETQIGFDAASRAVTGTALPLAASDPQREQAILGAKVLFSMALDRVIAGASDIALTQPLLDVVERATAHKPADRFADGHALAEGIAALIPEGR